MEFNFDINHLFGDEISVIDSRLIPSRRPPNLSLTECKERMRKVVDAMGAASTKAQGLYRIITTGRKLETSLNEELYVLKDAEGNSGRGLILGILKMGRRTLFVYDHHGDQHEVVPLCVLDFYVHESRQRMGCGRILFDFMLQRENVKPHHLAIDTPSSKFLPFLKKHYNLKAVIPQVNKFVVFEGFFNNRQDVVRRQGRVVGRPPRHPGSARARPVSEVRPYPDEIFQREKEALSHVSLPRSRSRDALNTIGIPTPPVPQEPRAHSLPTEGRNMAPPWDDVVSDNNVNHGYSAQAHMYSRHTANPTRIGSAGSYRENTCSAAQLSKKELTPPLLRREGPSRDYTEFHKDLNSHQNYQNGRGQLKVGAAVNGSPTHTRNIPRSAVPESNKPTGDHYTTRSAKPLSLNSNWSVFGVPPSYHGRKWQHTQLW